MEEVIKDYKNQRMDDILLKLPKSNQDTVKRYLDSCKVEAGNSTLIKYKSKIILIADTIQKDLNKLTSKDIEGFLILLNQSDKKIPTKNDIKKTLKRFLKWNYSDWSQRFDNLKTIRINSKKDKRDLCKEDLLTPDEMQMILNSVDSLKYKCILLLMQETANRPEEVLKLRWKEISFTDNEVKLNSSKTGETRQIPINESAKHLQRYRTECFYDPPRNEDFVFPTPRNFNKHITPQALSDFLSSVEKRLKFKKHLYPYLWRHSILSIMIKKLSPKVYEMYSGHALETGMKIYAHLDTEDLRTELYNKVYDMEELSPGEREEFTNLKKQVGELKTNLECYSSQIETLTKGMDFLLDKVVFEKKGQQPTFKEKKQSFLNYIKK